MDGEIMIDRATGVGGLLQSCRIKSGLSVADVARSLRIRQMFLIAIEEGRYGDLPGPAYAVGFLRAYADYLGLDANEVVRRFRSEASELNAAHELHFPEPDSESSVPKSGILLVGLLIAALGYGGWYMLARNGHSLSDVVGPLPDRLAELLPSTSDDAASEGTDGVAVDIVDGSPPPHRAPMSNAPAESPAPSTSAPGPATAPAGGPTETSSAQAESADAAAAATAPSADGNTATSTTGSAAAPDADPTSEPAPTEPVVAAAPDPRGDTTDDASSGAAPSEPVSAATSDSSTPATTTNDSTGVADADGIVLTATEASWVQVLDEGGASLISRILKPGERFDVPERPGLRMTVGNAGGLVVMVDGEALPPLGGSGVVLRRIPLDASSLRAASTDTP